MLSIAELQRDRSFRWRLVAICLSVALFVAAIYVGVSYRLAADVGQRVEVDALEQETQLIFRELQQNSVAPRRALAHLATTHYEHAVADRSMLIRVSGPDLEWRHTNQLSPELGTALKAQLERALSTGSSSRVLTLDSQQYVWHCQSDGIYQVCLVQNAAAFGTALQFVARRLSITTLIVFWITAWLAITLSSWVNKRVQEKNDALARLATHDSLTGLPNRLFLMALLDRFMSARAANPRGREASPPKEGCMLLIDLDKFKEVNDSFGHSAGDHLLKEVAARLSSVLSSQQTLVRTGGDEFIVWAPQLAEDAARDLAAALVASCNEPVMINDIAINTGASVGLAFYPEHATNAETLLICADAAMYDAKQKHCGWSLFAERDIVTLSEQRLRLKSDLGRAFRDEELKLVFQPKINMQSGEILGVEALARWHHPDEGVLPPHPFIELIEQSGRIQQFGRYVIRTAILQLARWQAQQVAVPIAVNLSPYNLLDLGLLEYTTGLLIEHGVSATMLEIELTESATSQNLASISHQLERFRNAGLRLAIDDFGTGMSSLAYISELNVDVIKIDKTFVSDMEDNRRHRAIIATTIALCRALNCDLVAEGIEHAEQARLLLEMGCSVGQGFHYSVPLGDEEMTQMLRDNQVVARLTAKSSAARYIGASAP